ncbi:MAG: hypothetical protein K0V04_20515 [Deltaproteobacteria bacterium]|nr:hypothetical protein [Deltaproteobacteria bacterium]
MMRPKILSAPVVLAVCFGVVSCDEPPPIQAEAKADTKADAKAAPPPMDPAELLQSSKTPTLPGPLARLSFGMTADQAKEAVPELGDGSTYLERYKGAYFSYEIVPQTNKLGSASLQIDGADMTRLLTEAWGAPKKGEDLGKPKLFWFNEADEIRATVVLGTNRQDVVRFSPYLPAKELLGEGTQTLGFERADRPLLGATREQLASSYTDVLEPLPPREIERRRTLLRKALGKEVSRTAAMGDITLLPTEYGGQLTRVSPHFGDDGTIDRIRVSLDWAAYPAAKEEILGLVEAKWGKPNKAEKYGKTLLIFHDAPRVVVEEDTISNNWHIEIEPTKTHRSK